MGLDEAGCLARPGGEARENTSVALHPFTYARGVSDNLLPEAGARGRAGAGRLECRVERFDRPGASMPA